MKYDYNEKKSYHEIKQELSDLDIEWVWPSTRIKKSRLKFFTKSLENEDIRKLLTPDQKLKRKIGKPKFRMVDAILNDLEDFEITGKDDNFNYQSLIKLFHLKSTNQRIINVMHICETHADIIEKL